MPAKITKEWLQVIARIGGMSRSPAKQAASRRNGCKGGRPRKNAREGQTPEGKQP